MKIIIAIGFLATLFSCESKKILTDEEKNICAAISFDKVIFESIKQQTQNAINLIPEIGEYGEVLKTKNKGLCSIVDEQAGYKYVLMEKENFRAKGYLLFLFEDNGNRKYIGTIKGRDELDIIKWRRTNAINYDYKINDIVKKLHTWRKQNDFIVLGVGMDWLHLKFKTMPSNINLFAGEVYEFCPDVVDQGAGDIPTLVKEIERMHGVYLWWD